MEHTPSTLFLLACLASFDAISAKCAVGKTIYRNVRKFADLSDRPEKVEIAVELVEHIDTFSMEVFFFL